MQPEQGQRNQKTETNTPKPMNYDIAHNHFYHTHALVKRQGAYQQIHTKENLLNFRKKTNPFI